MSDRVEKHEAPSVYERKDYVNIVKEDDDGSNDELSDEECMTPRDSEDEDQRSQALNSGGRQSAERYPPRGPHTLTEATHRKDTPVKSTTPTVTQKQTTHQARVLNAEKYRTQSQSASSRSSKGKESNSSSKDKESNSSSKDKESSSSSKDKEKSSGGK